MNVQETSCDASSRPTTSDALLSLRLPWLQSTRAASENMPVLVWM